MLRGQSSLCNENVNQDNEESRKMAKHLLNEFKDLRVRVWSFLKTAMHFLCFASSCSSLSYSSTLPQASQCGSCIFITSLSSLLLLHQSPSSSSLSIFDNETASAATVLRMINLSVHNFVSKGSFNCILNAAQKSRPHPTN